MYRLIFLWLTIASLLGLGASGGVTAAASLTGWGASGWTFYTPYAATPTLGQRVVDGCRWVQLALFPVAAVSSAVYLVLLDRHVRRAHPRGFDLAAATRPGTRDADVGLR